MADLSYLDAVILGVVEGLTEFLPVSSHRPPDHRREAARPRGDDPAVTAYTAVIQLGAIAATLALLLPRHRPASPSRGSAGWRQRRARAGPRLRPAWAVIIGSIPVGIVGFLARDLISGPLRSLWVVAVALLLWSVVMVVAERDLRALRGPRRPCAVSTRCARRRPRHRPRAVPLAHPRRLPLGCHDLGRPRPRHRPGHRDPASASSSRSRPSRPPACSRPSRRGDGLRRSAWGPCSSASSSPSSSPTPRSPGCCASSRPTP